MRLLEVEDLSVTYPAGRPVMAVRGVSFGVDSGEILGLAGESGSGKSTVALSLLRLLPASTEVRGQVLFKGEDVLTMRWSRLRAMRWAEASMVFQGAMGALNPVRTVGTQIREALMQHEKGKPSERAVKKRIGELLESVGLPPKRENAYPHELSGGQRQRVMIAMAVACRPQLIIADEPTTALDVVVQAQILDLLTGLVRDAGIGMVMISHDLSVLAETCDTLAVMYAGTIVEMGPSRGLIEAPSHPYTRALSSAFPRIGDPASRLAPAGLPGDPPDPSTVLPGCPFAPRCPLAFEECTREPVELWPSGVDRRSACLLQRPSPAAGSGPPERAEVR